jgi:DNA (cytosine-5)-methyltransferase 1
LPTFFEFFAGGGMVRAGLGDSWRCQLANDFDAKKCAIYSKNWGAKEIVSDDINNIGPERLPATPHLVWASFPCQDLSLAGAGAGLKGDRSGTFWPFWQRMEWLADRGPLPNFVVLENVCGTLTSHDGSDFAEIVRAFRQLDMRVGAMVIDAERFVPQSRPRLFFIGVPSLDRVPDHLIGDGANPDWHPAPLKRAYMRLAPELKESWLWWQMPVPCRRNIVFADLLEDDPHDVKWHSAKETRKLLAMMSSANRKKVEQARLAKRPMVGTIYKRTRLDAEGAKIQRAEVRFDDVAGCLRTPAGGSSRQTLMIVEGKSVRSRLISARETARLMGLPDEYELPTNYNEAYHLTGDGVVVPVVKHLSETIFLPTLRGRGEVALKQGRRLARR